VQMVKIDHSQPRGFPPTVQIFGTQHGMLCATDAAASIDESRQR